MGHSVTVSPDMSVRALLEQVGILVPGETPPHFELFLSQADAVWDELRSMIAASEVPADRGVEFQQLLVDIAARIMSHPVIAGNNYLRRFAQGVTEAQARMECQQFSIFALQFDVAQAKLVANAPTEEAYRERLNVLLNEKGIPYRDGFEGELTGRWSNDTVHFTWMLKMGEGLGLPFEKIAKIWLALPGTKAFVDATFENYAAVDPSIACGATFAIENWAANSLWKPWIAGMQKFNALRPAREQVDLGYLKYHDLEEQHHSQATLDELLESFVEEWFNSARFLEGAERMLTDGVQAYYESQLEALPDKDDSWPADATAPRRFDPADVPRLETATVPA
ncbi:MAG: hypothetical protein ACE5KM_20725 [Planctomycetaceae bacterium]